MKKIFLSLIILILTFSTQTIADNLSSIQRIFEGNEDAKMALRRRGLE